MKYIPVENNIDKALAFANSLDPIYNKGNQIRQNPDYINTIEIVETLQNKGWEIYGVDEKRGSNRRIKNHFVKLNNPNIELAYKNKNEIVPQLTISNSCNGSSPIILDLGVYRQVCTNGLIVNDSIWSHKVKHANDSFAKLEQSLKGLEDASYKIYGNIDLMRQKELSKVEMGKLALEAALLRYSKDSDFDYTQLLNVNRIEDEGSNLWVVYNRIQENLTKSIKDSKVDISINKQLFSLVSNF